MAVSETLEADDLLGSYATREAEAGGRVLVMTGDRDMFQCATQHVKVLYVRTGARGAELVGPREVRSRYGIAPALVPDFIALRGDPSDGIPGAKGIGEKTAAELLQRHGSLEKALDQAMRETKKTVRAALLGQREELLRFKEIATLQDVDVDLPADRAARRRGRRPRRARAGHGPAGGAGRAGLETPAPRRVAGRGDLAEVEAAGTAPASAEHLPDACYERSRRSLDLGARFGRSAGHVPGATPSEMSLGGQGSNRRGDPAV